MKRAWGAPKKLGYVKRTARPRHAKTECAPKPNVRNVWPALLASGLYLML